MGIIDSLIKRRLKAIMAEVIKKLLPDINALIDRIGTKAAVAAGAIAALYYLGESGNLLGWQAGIGIAVVAVAFFAFRRAQEKDGTCTCEAEDPDETA